jgi:hypothetical protein
MGMKHRNPFLVWLFGIITLGIYNLVWMVKLCREVEDVNPAHPKNVSGASAVCSTLFGGITLLIWPLVVFLKFGESVRNEQQIAGLQPTYSNGLAVLFFFLAGTHVCYIQSQQNRVVAAKMPTVQPITVANAIA